MTLENSDHSPLHEVWQQMPDKSKTTITREQWREDHDMQAAEIERLRAALKGYEVVLTHFENVFLEAQAKLREMQNV